MPAKITYYAIVNELSSRERPGGVIRRIVDDGGRDDQAFTRDLKWEHTGTLYSYERGDGDNKLYEISEDEANRIVERIRRTVADALQACGLGPGLPSRMTLGSGIARARNGLVDHTRSAAQDPPSSRKSLPPRASPSLLAQVPSSTRVPGTLHTSRTLFRLCIPPGHFSPH
jgi:hypothetical protein